MIVFYLLPYIVPVTVHAVQGIEVSLETGVELVAVVQVPVQGHYGVIGGALEEGVRGEGGCGARAAAPRGGPCAALEWNMEYNGLLTRRLYLGELLVETKSLPESTVYTYK